MKLHEEQWPSLLSLKASQEAPLWVGLITSSVLGGAGKWGGCCLIRRPLDAWHVDAGDPQWLTGPPRGAKVTSLVQPVLLLHEVYKHL